MSFSLIKRLKGHRHPVRNVQLSAMKPETTTITTGNTAFWVETWIEILPLESLSSARNTCRKCKDMPCSIVLPCGYEVSFCEKHQSGKIKSTRGPRPTLKRQITRTCASCMQPGTGEVISKYSAELLHIATPAASFTLPWLFLSSQSLHAEFRCTWQFRQGFCCLDLGRVDCAEYRPVE